MIVNRDSASVTGHPEPNNHEETMLVTTLLGLLAQAFY